MDTRVSADAMAIQLLLTFQNKQAYIDAIYYCPHHPDEGLQKYKKKCNCRKPKPGMIKKAAKDHNIDLNNSFLIGDKLSDIEAGLNAGCYNILVKTGYGEEEIKKISKFSIQPNYITENISDAANWISKL